MTHLPSWLGNGMGGLLLLLAAAGFYAIRSSDRRTRRANDALDEHYRRMEGRGP